MALIAFWPAIALAARQELHPVIRALSLGGATAMLCLWVGTQSKGGGAALALSAVVVFAVSNRRLRLLVPTAVVAVLGALAAEPLTEPFRTDGQAFHDAVRHAGTVTLALAGAGALAGLVYALVDRSLRVPDAVRVWAGRIVLGLMCAALLAGCRRDSSQPSTTQCARRRTAGTSSGSSIPTCLQLPTSVRSGSNRYDFWVVAWNEFERHPLAGIGAYGWGARTCSTERASRRPSAPTRSSSTRSRRPGSSASCWWSGRGRRCCSPSPAEPEAPARDRRAGDCGVLRGPHGRRLGVDDRCGRAAGVPDRRHRAVGQQAAAAGRSRRDSRRGRRSARRPPRVLAALALGALVERRTTRRRRPELATPSAGPDVWIRCSIDPYLAETTLVDSPGNIPPLRRAVAKEPRSADLRFVLGLALLNAGRKRTRAASFASRSRSRRAPRRIGDALARAR